MNKPERPNKGFHVASYRMDDGMVEIGYIGSIIHATVEDVNALLDPTERHLLKSEGHIVVVHMNGRKNVIVK
jgi:hypothetical protein